MLRAWRRSAARLVMRWMTLASSRIAAGTSSSRPKHRLQLSDAPDSALREAVDQAVRQFLDGAPEGPDGSRRALEPGRDALVILTDAAGSAPVRLHLKAVVARFPGLPREKPLDELAKNAPERKALKALLSHLRAAFASHDDGEVPTEDRLREIGGLLHVIALDLDPGGSDRVNAESHLRGVLDDPASCVRRVERPGGLRAGPHRGPAMGEPR